MGEADFSVPTLQKHLHYSVQVLTYSIKECKKVSFKIPKTKVLRRVTTDKDCSLILASGSLNESESSSDISADNSGAKPLVSTAHISLSITFKCMDLNALVASCSTKEKASF